MKSLYLLRHAKSSWDDPSLSDKQRPLNGRGRKNAPAMGKRFAARNDTLDRIISSPAMRAHSTAQLFAKACGFNVGDITLEPELYFSGSGSIEEVIMAQDDRVRALMLVFHNPDITYFANSIGVELRIDNVPTAGLVKFNCDIAQWRDWKRDVCAFEYFDYPKNPSAEPLYG